MSIILDPVTFVTFQLLLVGPLVAFYLFLFANLGLFTVPFKLLTFKDNGIPFMAVMFLRH